VGKINISLLSPTAGRGVGGRGGGRWGGEGGQKWGQEDFYRE
jgi:hypothetical protein